jgi:hypothetical protein
LLQKPLLRIILNCRIKPAGEEVAAKEITSHGAPAFFMPFSKDHAMMHTAITPAPILPRAEALVPAVARRWRSARDLGVPVQARLYALLSPRHWEMLTPAFDSLMALCESALRRPIATGNGPDPSRDEAMLIGMLDGSLPRRDCIECPTGPGRALDSAIRSTRIMMALVMSAPIGTQG